MKKKSKYQQVQQSVREEYTRLKIGLQFKAYIFYATGLFYTPWKPENIRKPEVFLCILGV